ncbi:glycosyltransferase family 39 protein [Candidatus Woesearchaeota archaeon]|nr:glycosyltransferase family 39 protein [Candidatus Woesearchaeota archaeon]
MLISIVSLTMLLIFLVVTFSIGRRILAIFKTDLGKLEEFLISVALGAGVIMNLTILLGTFKLLYSGFYIAMAVVAVVLFFKEVKRFCQLAMLLGKYIRQTLKPTLAGVLLLACIFFVLINFIPALSPVYEFDSMVYHLAFAKVYAGSHSLVYQPSQMYTTMPQGMTMLYTISELFSTPNLSPLIAYSFGILASLAIYALIRKKSSESAAITGVLLFFTAPVMIERLPQTMVDISVAYFFLAAVLVLFKYAHESDSRRRILLTLLCGILIGLATAVKLTGVFVAFAFVIGMVLSRLLYKKEVNVKQACIEIFLLAAVVLLLTMPWLARSYIHTGNPVYPLGHSIFGGNYLLPSHDIAYEAYHKYVGLGKNMANVLLVHWNITFNSKPFGTVIGLTPFFIMIIPLLIFFYKGVKDIRAWSIIFVMATAILMVQFWVHPVLRYMFPGIALLSAATAMVIDSMSKYRILKAAIFLMLIVSLAFNAAIWYGINAKSVNYFLSGESEGEYYDQLKDYNAHGAASWINANTTPDSVVLLFNEPRGYFLNREYVISSPHQNYIDYWSMSNTTDLLRRLKDLNISHILINDDLFDIYRNTINGSKAITLVHNLTEDEAQANLLYHRNRIRIYKI